MIQSQGVQPAPQQSAPAPRPRKVYPMDAQRLQITSPRPGTTRSQSVQMPVKGCLTGLELFVDTPDPGDRISVTLRDRTLVDRWFVDLANKASYEKDFQEEVEAGDILALFYFSNDASSKTATWTPTLEA